MDRYPGKTWSKIAGEAIVERVKLLEALEKGTIPGLTEKEATKIAVEIQHSNRGKGDWRKFLES